MRIGVISDTHDHLDPRVPELFAGVDHILHAGDVGTAWITFQLEQIAPVTAVLGNTDFNLSLRETEIAELGAHTFLVHHIVNPRSLDDALRRLIARRRPHAVVFGHTHKAFNEVIDGTLFLNPGYSGRPKLGLSRSAAILHASEAGLEAEFLAL